MQEPTWQEKFDIIFGKDGPEQNSDSIGVMAGCDDCGANVETRQKHKAFIESTLQEERERLREAINKASEARTPDPEDCSIDVGYDLAMNQILALLEEKS